MRVYAAFLLFLDMLFDCRQDLPIQGPVILFGYLSYLFQQMSGEPDGERLYIAFHVVSITLYWLRVKRLWDPCAQAPKQARPIPPPLKRRGLSGPLTVTRPFPHEKRFLLCNTFPCKGFRDKAKEGKDREIKVSFIDCFTFRTDIPLQGVRLSLRDKAREDKV
jgi:hypothetical protein